MAYFQDLPKFKDERGVLTLIEDSNPFLPFKVQRIFCIHNPTELSRGGHKHIKTVEAVICVKGSCIITTFKTPGTEISHRLWNTDQCLILPADEWRILHEFSSDAFLIVFASEKYDVNDYVFKTEK